MIDRAGIDAATVEDVITGCVQQYGEQSYNIGRNAWLQAGLPIETPATTIDRQCGSAQQAVNFAAALVASGVHDVAIGGGVEHMGHIPLSVEREDASRSSARRFRRSCSSAIHVVHQGLSAELIAEKWGVSRDECDEIALRSQQRAARATDEGRFEREIMPFRVNGDVYTDRPGHPARDDARGSGGAEAGVQGGRRRSPPATRRRSPTAPPRVLLMSREKADELGVQAARAHRRPDHRRRRSRC